MGKASRRKHGATADQSSRPARVEPAPFVARPFEGLPNETDWVAMREILPAATATVRFAEGKAPEGAADEVTVATVLPLAWPGLHRADGSVFIGTQSGSASGDASRDLAVSLLAAASAEQGTPVAAVPQATAETPRLQDLLDTTADFDVTVHEGFDFWISDVEDREGLEEALQRANDAASPTARLTGVEAAYWTSVGSKEHLRWVMPEPEDELLTALARLHVTRADVLVPGARFVGMFRALGLLAPVWDLPVGTGAEALEGPAAAFRAALDEALAAGPDLTPEERSARAGLANRQVTIR